MALLTRSSWLMRVLISEGLTWINEWVIVIFFYTNPDPGTYSTIKDFTSSLGRKESSIHLTNPVTRRCSVHVTNPVTCSKITNIVHAFGPSVLPVRKLNSHESERKEEWLCLDSLTDIPPNCLVDSLDDAGSGIVLLYFLEVERWGCLEITKTTIIVLPAMETVKTLADSSHPSASCTRNVKHLDLIFK